MAGKKMTVFQKREDYWRKIETLVRILWSLFKVMNSGDPGSITLMSRIGL